jgi:hypothetical protein
MNIWNQLDQIGKCGKPCPSGGFYCAPYVGPDYESSEPRVMFVGLDHGERRSFNAIERRNSVIDWWEKHPFKDHYQGCIWVAAELLRTCCRLYCQGGCVKVSDPNSDCALRRFSQTNAVRCVGNVQSNMTFRNQSMVRECVRLVFEDIRLLRPQVIVLQGRNRQTGHLQESFLAEARKQRGSCDNSLDFAGAAVTDLRLDHQQIIVASLRHPSHGWLKRDWDKVILPVLGEINRRLG